jgi:hypothetical protein
MSDVIEIEMHPHFNTARRKLRDIKRIVRKPWSTTDLYDAHARFAEALLKHPDGRQCVLFVEDLI